MIMDNKFCFVPMVKSDLSWFLNIRNQVRNSLHDSREFTIEEATCWWEELKPEFWKIFYFGEAVGYFRISNIELNSCFIGADLHPAHQGKGIGFDAYTNFIEEVIRYKSYKLLKLRVLKSNTIAINLYQKLNFKIIEDTEIDYLMERIV